MSAIRPAATVVLLRESGQGLETLLLHRHSAVVFAGDLWVFPGGRIDSDDFAGDRDDLIAAARRAAIRETHEETGLDIESNSLQFFAHWTTPEGEVKRYATWFFVTAIPGDEPVVVDGAEIDGFRWMRPGDALHAHRAGELDLLPPTYIALRELSDCDSVEAVFAMYRDRPIVEILPKFVQGPHGTAALYPGDIGYESGDLQLPGPRHRSRRAADGWHYECDF